MDEDAAGTRPGRATPRPPAGRPRPVRKGGPGQEIEAVLEEYEATIAEGVAREPHGALSVAVFQGSRTLWARSWGLPDRPDGPDAPTEMSSPIGSISKCFTGALAMQLVEERIVDLDDPAVVHVPEIAGLSDPVADPRRITLRHLARHTSGLEREPALDATPPEPEIAWEEALLRAIPATRLSGPPGESYSYSNIGFAVLGLALSRAAQADFRDLVRERIFEPLGLRDTFFRGAHGAWPRAPRVGPESGRDVLLRPAGGRSGHRGQGDPRSTAPTDRAPGQHAPTRGPPGEGGARLRPRERSRRRRALEHGLPAPGASGAQATDPDLEGHEDSRRPPRWAGASTRPR